MTHDPRATLAVALALWEIVAITTGQVPTITAVWHRLRTHPIGRWVLWSCAGYVIEHLWVEDRRCANCST